MTTTTKLLFVSRFRAVEALPRFERSRFGYFTLGIPPGIGDVVREVLLFLVKAGKFSLAL